MKYQITGFIKHAEKDNFEHGCVGDCQSSFIDYRIVADSLESLKKKCEEFTGGELGEFFDDEPNRLDFQVMEDSEGYKASERQMEQFKAGKIDLYLCDYSCHVEIVQDANCSSLFSKGNDNV